MSNSRFKLKKEKPHYTARAYPYVYKFYLNESNLRKDRADGTFLRIVSENNEQFGLSLPGNSEAYGYLYAAAKVGDLEQLRTYASVVFGVAMLLINDQEFANDVCESLYSWNARKFSEAEIEAEKVDENTEMVAQTFMEDLAQFSDAPTDHDRDQLREMWKGEVATIVKDEFFNTDYGDTGND